MLGSLLKQWLAQRRAGANPAASFATLEHLQDGAREALTEGVSYQNSGQLERAESAYRSVLGCHPDQPEAVHLLGTVLSQQGRLAEAIATFQKMVGLNPRSAEAQFNLANAYGADEKFSAAILGYRKVIELDPQMAAAHNNLGNAYTILGRLEHAVDSYRQALRLKPQFAEALNNLGHALRELGRTHEAIHCYEKVLVLVLDHADAHFNLSLALLSVADFARGWREYEWRFEPSSAALARRYFPHPTWQGEPLAGKTVLIWGEQGIGDEIHFAGLVPELIDQGAHCVIECSAKLVALLRNSFPQAEVVARTEPPDPRTLTCIDFQVAMGGLARWLRPSLASFPQRAAFLVPAADRVAFWRQRLGALGAGTKIGFSWRSNNLKGERALAFTELTQWGPIFAVTGVHFICLQYDECTRELEAARASFGVPLQYFGEVDMFNDLAETAALMQALDLVVSAPTAVSRLAAALGVPTWQLTYGADWQTHGTDRQPWYPAMRRFVRGPDQDWAPVMTRVAMELAQRAGK